MGVAKNYVYNVLYQILNLIIPFITIPYVSRVLGANGIGINSYTSSIVQYFVLIGMLGIEIHGSRTVATVRESKENLSKNFWSIYFLQLTTCSISIVVYFIFSVFIIREYRYIFFIQSLMIFAAAIDISWFFIGIENLKKIIVRNTIVRFIGIILIFSLVRRNDQLWLYCLILGLSSFLGQASMWRYLKKVIYFDKIHYRESLVHLKPSLELIIPLLAIKIYAVLDKIMIGILSTKVQVGIYENSEKIVKLSIAIVTSLATVMMPRVANTFSKGNLEKVKEYIIASLNFVSFLSIPIMLGVIGIANEFVPWFLGKEFSEGIIIIIILSPITMFMAWASVLGNQYLLAIGRNREYAISVTLAAGINFILNLFLIRVLNAKGAAISTVIAQGIVTLVQIMIIRKEINVLEIRNDIIKYFLSASIMFVSVRLIGINLGSTLVTTVCQIIFGGIIYMLNILFLKPTIVDKIMTIGRLKK